MAYISGTCVDISVDTELPLLLNKHTHIFLTSAIFDKYGKLVLPLAFYDPGSIIDKYISGMCSKLFEFKMKNRGVKLLLTVLASDNLMVFNKIICDDVYKETLVESICDAVRNYGLDGVDIKWQHPVSGVKPEKFANFIKTLKFRFTQIQMLHGYPVLTICITINPRITSLEYYNLDLYDEYIDLFHLKGYDIGENWMKYVSHYNISYHDLRESVKYLNRIGTRSEKILIGIPFHGHVFEGTSGLGQTYTSSRMVSHMNIYSTYVTYNKEYGVSSTYNEKENTYTSFEDETSIYNKIEYMKEEGLGGVVTSETDDTLTNYISSIIPIETSNNNIVYITSAFTNIASPQSI